MEADPPGLVDHQRHPGSALVDGAEAGGEPGDAVGCVGRAVQRIEDDENVAILVHQARLLAQHAETRGREHVDGSPVGHKVGAVLPGPGPRRAPVREAPQSSAHRVGRRAQRVEEGLVVHRGRRYRRPV